MKKSISAVCSRLSQSESAAQVNEYMKTHGRNLSATLDLDGRVSAAYLIDGGGSASDMAVWVYPRNSATHAISIATMASNAHPVVRRFIQRPPLFQQRHAHIEFD